MSKMKTNRAAAKRFKLTGSGRIKRNKAYHGHLFTAKSPKRLRNLRKSSLHKPPGIAESLDWAKTLLLMNEGNITDEIVQNTIGCVLKHKDDIEFVRNKAVQELLVLID